MGDSESLRTTSGVCKSLLDTTLSYSISPGSSKKEKLKALLRGKRLMVVQRAGYVKVKPLSQASAAVGDLPEPGNTIGGKDFEIKSERGVTSDTASNPNSEDTLEKQLPIDSSKPKIHSRLSPQLNAPDKGTGPSFKENLKVSIKNSVEFHYYLKCSEDALDLPGMQESKDEILPTAEILFPVESQTKNEKLSPFRLEKDMNEHSTREIMVPLSHTRCKIEAASVHLDDKSPAIKSSKYGQNMATNAVASTGLEGKKVATTQYKAIFNDSSNLIDTPFDMMQVSTARKDDMPKSEAFKKTQPKTLTSKARVKPNTSSIKLEGNHFTFKAIGSSKEVIAGLERDIDPHRDLIKRIKKLYGSAATN